MKREMILHGQHKLWLAVVVLCCTFIVMFMFLHFKAEIERLQYSKLKLEQGLAKVQLSNIDIQRRSVYPTQDEQVIIYNRVPKTGSTSFMGVAYDLCTKNHFNVLHINTTRNSHTMSLADQVRFAQNVSMWTSKKPAIYHGHVAFFDFTKYGVIRKPLHINIIRKPLDRLVSYYYFLRHGDDFRPHLVRRKQGDKKTFDECVIEDGDDCHPDNMWMQIPFFCGHEAACWKPGNRWALERAKANLVSHYFLVGLTEELYDFVAMLEVTLPHFFRGAQRVFLIGDKNHLRKTFKKQLPSDATVRKIHESKVWQMEDEFYEFVREQFHFQKRKTLIDREGFQADRGKRFFYEKIRPK